MRSKFTVLIPSRMGSTRLAAKALLDLGGVPMVVRCCEIARNSGANRVVVATDHELIQKAVEKAGYEGIMTGEFLRNGTERLAQAVEKLHLNSEEIVVNLQGDEPTLDPEMLSAMVDYLEKNSHCDMTTLCYPLIEDTDLALSSVVKVVLNAQSEALYFSRAPIPFSRDRPLTLTAQSFRHVGVYAYTVDFLKKYSRYPVAPLEEIESLEQLRALWYGHRIGVIQGLGAYLGGVDTPEDAKRIEKYFKDVLRENKV